MARSRVPQVPGLIFLALRLGGLALSIASLYYLVYLATHWPKRHTFYWAIFSASTAIVVDLVEVCCLLDASFTIKRPDEAWLIFGNIISMILGGIGIWQMVWSDWGLSDAPPDYPRPWQDTMYLALPLASTVPVARFMFSILECVMCCRRFKRRERRKKEEQGTALRSVYPPVVEGAPNDA